MRTAVIRCIVASVLMLASSLASAAHQVAYTIKPLIRNTQVILTIPETIEYRDFTLTSPSRFVLDLYDKNLQWVDQELLDNPVIKAIRHSVDAKHNRLRLVFDLNYQTDVSLHKQSLINHSMRLTLSFQNKQAFSHGRDVIVVIDPGHGGKDPGALGRRHRREKDIVLSIAKKLQQSINQQRGFKAYLTRSTDRYLTLRQRLEIARRYHADMFIAIHADAYRRKAAQGASVYALSLKGASSEAARWLANRENASELMGGVELGDKSHLLKSVLLDLSQTATLRASLNIGEQVLNALGKVTKLHHAKVEQAAFVVLKSPDIPSLLIETGFISNWREELKLSSSRYQKHLASAITAGIKQYFLQKPPRGSWLSSHMN